MKSQINYLLFIIIAALISLSFILYFLLSYNYSISKQTQPVNQYESTIQNSVTLLPYINDQTVNLSYAFLLSYWSSSGNDTYCINSYTCTNISQDITNYFNSIYGDRWNLTIYFLPSATGWLVQMFLFNGNSYDWDSCQINPPSDSNGVQWYEWNYTYFFTNNYTTEIISPSGKLLILKGAGWVNATAPFHQQDSCYLWGIRSLYSPATCTGSALEEHVCIPLSDLYPSDNFTNASVYCPNGEWALFQDLYLGYMVPAFPSTKLPSFFRGCNLYQYCIGHYYVNPPAYKTATNINLLAYDLGISNNLNDIVGSFYRGTVYIPQECQQVFIDYPWHEVLRLYIAYVNSSGQPDYIFLAADPECTYNGTNCPQGVFNNTEDINGTIVGKQCPLVYLVGGNCDPGACYSYGLYQFNITRWAILDRDPSVPYIIISGAYWDPHSGSNGIAEARVYCLTKYGTEIELNAYISQEQSNSITLGYPVPPGVNVYTYDFYYPTSVPYANGYLVAILKVW